MKADDIKVSFMNLTKENKKNVIELMADLILIVQRAKEEK